jgi:adenosylhomocysteinase
MNVMINNNDRAYTMYQSLLKDRPKAQDVSLIIVQHILPNTLPLLRSLHKHHHVACVIPKPRSIETNAMDFIEQSDERLPIMHLTRNQTSDKEFLIKYVKPCVPENNKVIILDIGGYFASSIKHLQEMFGNRILGIVEDTENGHQKYQSSMSKLKSPLSFPVFSVARSPLKEPEDYLVGQSIVYSIERILRDNSTLLTNKSSLVIGYGKIGKSVANSLSSRNITVYVHDKDPIRRAQALSHGYSSPDREVALANADLVIGASGNKSLRFNDFKALKDNCFVASVTSGDDEFEIDELREEYRSRDNKNGVEIYYLHEKSFFLMNQGNAVNFAYSNILGPYIYLVACEIIHCMNKLIDGDNSSAHLDKINTLNTPERQLIADVWMKYFGNGK